MKFELNKHKIKMKKSAKLVTSLLLLCWAFISACSNCDDGDLDNNSNENRQTVVSDSTFVK